MLINPFTFLISRSIAQNRGVDSTTATRDAFVGSIIKPPMLGVVLVSAIAQNQAGSLPVLPPGTAPILVPKIDHIMPSSPLPGTFITLSGSNLKSLHHKTIVKFDGNEGNHITAHDAQTVGVFVPEGVKPGRVKVTVTVGAVTSDTYELKIS
jgi:hypothetical protein